MDADYDLIVIGAGPGGYVAAMQAAKLGLKVACIEKEVSLGGTCLNVGCIPSKALLQSTEHYSWLKEESREHGIACSDLSIDFSTMMERKRKIVEGLAAGIASQFKQLNIDWLKGKARFVDPHRIELLSPSEGGGSEKNYSARHFIIAAGSVPIALPSLPFDEERILSSTGALALGKVPKRLGVIGGGAIGVELASVYRRLGSEVTIIEMLPKVIPTMDEAISRSLAQSLQKQGIALMLSAKLQHVDLSSQEEIGLNVEAMASAKKLHVDALLVAIGRKPNAEALNLSAIGIALDKKGCIPVDVNLRTAHPHIYAIGDLIEGPMLAHRASHEGMAAAELIAGKVPFPINYASLPNVVYTYPEAASVGLTESEAEGYGFKVIKGISFFRANGRARCNGELDGFVKVIGDAKTKRLLGMHIIGAKASELIAEGVIALDKKATLGDIAFAFHAHPTLAETAMEACRQALGEMA